MLWHHLSHWFKQYFNYLETESNGPEVNPRVEPQGLINFMVQNHPGSNQERVEIETLLQ